ncbi:MAG: hypothetical protein ACKVGW_18225 [Verrucomicrobiia bacterium]
MPTFFLQLDETRQAGRSGNGIVGYKIEAAFDRIFGAAENVGAATGNPCDFIGNRLIKFVGDVIVFDELANPARSGSLELNDDVFARLLVIVGRRKSVE